MEKSVESFRFAMYLELAGAKESKAEFIRAIEELYGSDAIGEANHIFDEWVAAKGAETKYDYTNYLGTWKARRATAQRRTAFIDAPRYTLSKVSRAVRAVRLGPVLGALILLGAAAWWFTSCEESNNRAAKEAARQAAIEQDRIRHPDPLMRLAGCMANRATDVSKTVVAGFIVEIDSGKSVSDDALKQYMKVYKALFERCEPVYLADAQAAHPRLTTREVSVAFLSIMRHDSEVARWVETFGEVSRAASQVYVK